MGEYSVKKDYVGKIMIICTALLWGLGGVCVKSISWGPLSIMAARCIFASAIIALMRGKRKLKFTKQNIIGAVMLSVTGIIYIISLKLTTAASAIVLQYTAPIFVYLFFVIFKKRKCRISEMIIVVAVFCGCVLSFVDKLDGGHMLGNALALLSGVTYSGQIIAFTDFRTDSEDAMLIGNLLSITISLPFALFDKNVVFDAKNIIWICILGIFQYGCANVLYTKGCHRVGRIECSLLLTIEPVFNPIMVALVCHEYMGIYALLGFIIVIASVTAYTLLPQKTHNAEQ